MCNIGTMSTVKGTKINQLLSSFPKEKIFISSWLAKVGYSLDLQKRYKKSGWLESIGRGALIRSGDQVTVEDGIRSLQFQLGLDAHPGGRSALALHGKAHYLEFSRTKLDVFGGANEKLPSWFIKHDWGLKIRYHSSSFLPSKAGLTTLETGEHELGVSNPARAMMECLYLTPEKQELMECYELMEFLNTLNPKQVQSLLEDCTSVKVKRLFLYLGEKSGHKWMDYLKLNRIDLGTGKRSLVKGGVYIPKYQIIVPRALEEDGKRII